MTRSTTVSAVLEDLHLCLHSFLFADRFSGGPDDPRICAIRVRAITAQYAISKRTAIGGFVEFAKGVATGQAPDVSKLRYIDEGELQKWRESGSQA